MDIKNSIALVTGANRGFGRHLAAQLLDRGAAKVYATARNPAAIDVPGVVPLRLDITDPASVAAVAAAATDVTLLINNAGLNTGAGLLDGDLADLRLELETNFFGPLAVSRAFAPILAGNGGGANGGGAIVNVLSILSWLHLPRSGGYSAAKAAAWAMTNVLRQELAPAGVDVLALHVGPMDTDMAGDIDAADKVDPAMVAAETLDAVQAGGLEFVADEITRRTKAALSGDLALLYPTVGAAS